MKKILTFFWVLLLVQLSFAQQVTVPTDNANGSSSRRPLGGYWGYERAHMLYTGAEIGSSGNITAISFYVNSVGSPSDSPAEVYLKLSSNTSVSSSTVADVQTGATLVWSGTIAASSLVADSWITIPLSTPFAYNAGTNLEVLVKNNAGGSGNEGSTAKQFRHATTTENRHQYWTADNSEPTGTGTTSTSRPNIRIDLAPSAANTVGIGGVVSPAGSCNLGASMPVTVKIRNNGTNAQNNVTIPVFYSINGGAAVAGSFTGSIASGATANYTFPTNANLSTPGTYTFKFWTALVGDASTADDTLKNYSVNKIAPATITPVTFDGYDGTNLGSVFTGWSEGNGQAKPTGTSSIWNSNTSIFSNDVLAAINLYTTGKKEWIVSPMIVPTSADAVSFKVALRKWSANAEVSAMGSDDSLSVRISSDCGATWQTVYSITAANAPTALEKTEFSVPISAYAGQEIRVGFFATEGSSDDAEDYYVLLDDIEVITLAPNNTGVTQIVSPTGNCGLSAASPVTVKIRNFGTAAQTSIPVQYTINGGTPVTATYTGTLAAGATTNYTFPTTANLGTPGTYVIEAKTNLVGDANTANDAKSAEVTKIGATPLPSVDFGGYTGANISTVFPGWIEATGQQKPTGTTSSWTSNPTAFPEDTVASLYISSFSASKKEWFVSPLYNVNASDGLSFKLALRQSANTGSVATMDADDSVSVRVTNNCGATWQTIYNVTAANAPTALEKTEFVAPLAAFAGQEVQIGLFATEGTTYGQNAYYIFLDDINIKALVPNNAGVTKIVAPVGNCGLSASSSVTVTIRNHGTATQTSIPVKYSINGGSPVTETFTGSLAAGASANYTFNTAANLGTAGTYALSAWTSLAGDNITNDDSSYATVTKLGAEPFVAVDFTGFTGANLGDVFTGWSEGNGQAKPQGTTSSWGSNNTLYSSDIARINLYTASKKEWLVSPLYVPAATDGLSFKVGLRKYSSTGEVGTMGSDDSLNVRITTDCGATWQTIYSINAGNAPTDLELIEKVVPLAAYAGQEVRLALFATEGVTDDSEDYWVSVDDININALIPNNIGVTSIVAPTGACGTLTSSTPITVKVYNTGTATQYAIPVNYSVNGGAVVSETFSDTLAPGASEQYTFTTTANFDAPGAYTIVAWTSLGGDIQLNNDSASASYHTGFVPVDFTGFTGSNISTVFPGWNEANGYMYPGGTTSSWGSNSAIFSSTVASINLYAASKNEWFISPSFKAGNSDGLSFKVALRKYSANDSVSPMGSDDTLAVKVSTDCGATWTNIYNVTATNAPTSLELTEFAASLAPYAGQNIQVALVATEGVTNDEEDYYVYLDDIQLRLLAPNDLGVTRIIAPASNCGMGNQATISVKIRNFGTAAQSNFPVKYAVNNAVVTETFTGTLAAGDSVTYDFATPASVSAAQVYNFGAWTNLDGDADGVNNGALKVIKRYGSPLPVVDFTNYATNNVIAEGWNEAVTSAATTGDSQWKSGGISGNATARITLAGDTINEWMISPPVKLYSAPVVTFKAALRTANNGTTLGSFGADDKVAVMVSTDCGATWTELFALNSTTSPALTAALTSYTVDLANYANQEVKIAFKATDGTIATTSCDVHLDDILVRNNLALDGGAAQLISPPAQMTPSTTYPVVVRVSNYGNSSFSNYNITAMIGNTSYPGFIFATVQANSFTELTLGSYTSPATVGVISGYAYTEVSGDQDIHNDTTYATFAVTPVGVKDKTTTSVAIYPNPNKGSFKVDLANVEGKEAIVRLYSTTGQKVYEGSFHGLNTLQAVEVQTENLPTGMYLLNLEVDGKRFVGKVSIQK